MNKCTKYILHYNSLVVMLSDFNGIHAMSSKPYHLFMPPETMSFLAVLGHSWRQKMSSSIPTPA
ncbi:hypothetical protein RSAG8_14001, partial [Rhizoctonia solani AG-8 WAC10335]